AAIAVVAAPVGPSAHRAGPVVAVTPFVTIAGPGTIRPCAIGVNPAPMPITTVVMGAVGSPGPVGHMDRGTFRIAVGPASGLDIGPGLHLGQGRATDRTVPGVEIDRLTPGLGGRDAGEGGGGQDKGGGEGAIHGRGLLN